MTATPTTWWTWSPSRHRPGRSATARYGSRPSRRSFGSGPERPEPRPCRAGTVVDPAASAPAALHEGGAVGADARSGRRFLTVRAAIVGDDTVSAAERRSALVELSDAWLAGLFDALPPASTIGMSLVAVGGYGRRELLPCSDLDVLLLHADGGDVAAVANGVFYPVWDSGVALDHAVRTVAEARAVAADDLAVALGLVDARHVAGDPKVTESLRTGVLRDWRRQAAVRLPKLAQAGRDRLAEVGELAHLLEPDLKQAYGGLRDIVALRAVAASWVADRPHAHAVSEAHEWLLVVRDALHRTTGRRHDRLVFEDQDTVAASLGLLDADALMRRVAEAGRAIAYATDVTWRQVERTLRARPGPGRSRRPVSRRLGHGVVEHDGEAVLARDARPQLDPVIPLRAAAGAAQAGLVLSPATVERLAIECPPLPPVWPDAARDALVALLGAGRAAVPVWDSLEAAGLIVRWFPEWEPVRYRPQRTPVHRHTVDRHQVEAAVVAAGLTRRVSRPDLLLLAALFHDLGKGGPGDHSETGAAIVTELGGGSGCLSLMRSGSGCWCAITCCFRPWQLVVISTIRPRSTRRGPADRSKYSTCRGADRGRRHGSRATRVVAHAGAAGRRVGDPGPAGAGRKAVPASLPPSSPLRRSSRNPPHSLCAWIFPASRTGRAGSRSSCQGAPTRWRQ